MIREEFNEIKSRSMLRSKIVSDSMVPILNIGDEVLIDVGSANLKRFDIIVFYNGEKLVCHYLWQMNILVKPLLLQTRNMSGGLDYPIPMEDYLGKVISHKLSLWRKLAILFK